MEEWRDIEGYEGLYQVSNLGRVKSLNRFIYKNNGTIQPLKGKICAMCPDNNNYIKVSLCKNGKYALKLVHRLVAIAFIPNPENKPEIDHINTDRKDNRVENLRWCTHKENVNNPLTISKYNANTGRIVSNETREKISLALKGRKMSKESISRTIKGTSKPIIQLTLDGNFIKEWESATIIERDLHLTNGNIGKCCKGLIKQSYGFIWKYKYVYDIEQMYKRRCKRYLETKKDG